MLDGKKVRLRAYHKEDLETVVTLINDPDVKKLLTPGIPFPYTLEDENKWYESISGNSTGLYNFAIETLEDSVYLGGCGINSIDWKNSVAVIGIFIGRKDYWGKGFGTDAMEVLIDFIFDQMNIRKIRLNVFEFNVRAYKSYLKCGFKVEGTLKAEIFRDGRYYDEYIMGLFRDDR
ncbi:GNAT family N-acetyltransferase [Fusibacter tunisiensis]|uniref:RimJ/RimL family protein N-acetyltransferase n=1 Tax=Fusibacter tunisiensis TaxID=1008308 RepID=A0ABS2MPN8_9FIRM|nr:GNAT family protein [Fusibacter tunisiensis]MBM7561342.1 RimJ/RimL family protein N-acetyltransferase [Fusibacter tunisiensis]